MAPKAPSLTTLFACGPLIEQGVIEVMSDHPILAPYIVEPQSQTARRTTAITCVVSSWKADLQAGRTYVESLNRPIWTAYLGELEITVDGCRTKDEQTTDDEVKGRNAVILAYITALFGCGNDELNQKLPYYEIVDMWVQDGDSRRAVEDHQKIAWDVRGVTFGFRFNISVDSFVANMLDDDSSSS